LTVTAVVKTGILLNETLSPMLKSLVVWVLLIAIVIVTGDDYPVHFFLLKVTEFSRIEDLATVRVGTRGSLFQIGSNAYTAKTETAV
jgi:hypothetical protein